MGPGDVTTYNPHCLRRDFAPLLAMQTASQSVVDFTNLATSFADYDHRVQAWNSSLSGVTTHGGGHFGVGGNVGDVRSQPHYRKVMTITNNDSV
jgi:tyrosinase